MFNFAEIPHPYLPAPEALVPPHDIEHAAPRTVPKILPGVPAPVLRLQSVCEASFASSRSSFRKARAEYSIPCWSARWLCTPESPQLIESADIHPGFLVRHPFKSPFTPISRIAEGQLFEIWEYYLIFRKGWVGGRLLSGYLLPITFAHAGGRCRAG